MEKENSAPFLSTNLRFLRKQRKLSQEELARRVGLNRGNIASYENGGAEPRICNLIKIANLLDVSIIQLTQVDLRRPAASGHNGQALPGLAANGQAHGAIRQFARQAQEIEQVFHSLHTCCAFKTRSMDEVPKDLQILLVNFEQLHEAAQTLLGNHKELIELLQHRQA